MKPWKMAVVCFSPSTCATCKVGGLKLQFVRLLSPPCYEGDWVQ